MEVGPRDGIVVPGVLSAAPPGPSVGTAMVSTINRMTAASCSDMRLKVSMVERTSATPATGTV